MTKGFRQSQSTLHTWSGLLLGWVLFLVFVAGTAAFWREALNRWMQPELPRVEQPLRSLAGAQRFLDGKAPDAASWFITMANAESPGTQVFWVPKPKEGEKPRRRGRRDTSALIDATGAPAAARATRGGEFFYRFHFDLHYMPVIWARWLVGVAAMMMLVAILTGIVTHKKIFTDFFTLRRNKGQRSWLDGHNATAVLALPFHLMITYTGLVTLMAMLMPWAAIANYTDQTKIYDALFPQPAKAERADRPVPLAPLAAIVADGERRLGAPIGYVEVANPNDAAARVTLTQAASAQLSARAPRLTYEGATGRLLWRSPPPDGAVETQGVMVGLHAGRFGDMALRWLYFLCGVGGCLMVVSGLVLWTVKRRERLADPARPPLGFRIVERLNIAVVAGFPLGCAAFFWANRLLPLGTAGRAEAEIAVLFEAWGAAAIVALILTPRLTWAALLATTAALLAGIVAIDALVLPRGIAAWVAARDWTLVAVEPVLLVLALFFAWAARRVLRHRPAAKRPRRQAPRMTPIHDPVGPVLPAETVPAE